MANDDRPRITTRLGQKNWILTAGAVVLLLVIAVILFIIFGGMQFADPRGEQLGPGP